MAVVSRSESTLLVEQLPNGLQILGQRIPGVESAAAMFWVNTGTRDEPPSWNGISHFLEHMAFKRTATRTYEDINREFEEMGAENNAFTWLEMTAFYARVLGDQLPHAVELLADLTRPVLDGSDFDQERQVILEEIARHQDQPYSLVVDEFLQACFPDQPLGRPTLGTADTISAMKVEDMRTYWRERYGPANTIMAVAGNFDWHQLTRQVEELSASWHPGSWKRAEVPTSAVAGVRVLTSTRWNQQHIVLGSPSIPRGDGDYYVAAVLANILGDDTGSRLYWAVNQTGLADVVGSSTLTFVGAGLFYTIVVTAPGKATEALDVTRQEIERLQSGPIEAEEVERAKTKLLTSVVIEGESTRARMMGLVDSWLSHGRLETLEEVRARIEAVSVADLQRLLERYPLTEEQVLTALGPLDQATLAA
ncbi:MAG TPA: pitrilysin family protein [Chloroflexota bacterium]|nr:pitrilysin family protein [Chloroflexota bacterium]